MLALALALAGCSGSSSASGHVDPARYAVARTSPARITFGSSGTAHARAGTTHLCCTPHGVTSTGTTVWVAAGGHVLGFSGDSTTAQHDIDVGGRPTRMVATGTALWAVDPATNSVLHIDTRLDTVVARIPVGSTSDPVVDIARTGDGIWALLDFSMTVVQIDPASSSVVDRRALCPQSGCSAGALAAGGGRLYAIASGLGRVFVIDRGASRVLTDLGAGTWTIAATGNRVITLNRDDGRLLVIDPSSPAKPIAKRSGPRSLLLTVGAESVWTWGTNDRTLRRYGLADLTPISHVALDHVVAFDIR